MNIKVITTLTKNIATYTMLFLLAVLPVFFLPTTMDFFDTNKRLLVFATAILTTSAWIVYTAAKKTIRITISRALLPVVLFSIAVLLSTFLASPYYLQSLFAKTTLIVSLSMLFITLTSLGTIKNTKYFLYALNLGALVISITSILQASGFGISTLLNKTMNLQLPTNILFQLTGSLLSSTLLLIPIALANIVEIFAVKKTSEKIMYGIVSALLTAGVIVNLYFMLPNKIGQLNLLPMQASWSIAIDTLKTAKSALVGVGPDSYSTAFTQFRPAQLNLTPSWNLRYGSARLEPFNILTTLGVLGLISWLFFLVSALKTALPLHPEHRPLSITLIGLIAVQLLFPASLILIALTYLILAAIVIVQKQMKHAKVSDVLLHLFAFKMIQSNAPERTEPHQASQVFSYIIAVILLALAGVSSFFVARTYATDVLFYQSIIAATQNNGDKTYQIQAQVVRQAPYNDTYRRAFAGTNFLIASAISRNQDATEQDKANIAPLLQQAIQEAKIATDIDPRKTANWETLSNIYKELVTVAQGADQWTIAAYVRAIQTDPTNPALRFELGTVYVTLQNYEQAARIFQQAVELKPDWANAYYNLANSYKQKGETALALQALKQTYSLLPANSENTTQVSDEIDELQKIVDDQMKKAQQAQQIQQGTQTSAPPSLPEGQIKIPEDLGLPQEEPPTTVPEKPTSETEPTPKPEGQQEQAPASEETPPEEPLAP